MTADKIDVEALHPSPELVEWADGIAGQLNLEYPERWSAIIAVAVQAKLDEEADKAWKIVKGRDETIMAMHAQAEGLVEAASAVTSKQAELAIEGHDEETDERLADERDTAIDFLQAALRAYEGETDA